MTFYNKVNWVIEPDRSALLIHGIQPHYLAAVPANQRAQIINNVGAIGTACADRDIPIFASQVPATCESRECGLMLDMWGNNQTADGYHLESPINLPPGIIRPLSTRSYSAFYGTDFELMLRRLGRDSVIIVGVHTSSRCYHSAADAFMRDIRPFLISDAMGDVDASVHSACLANMARTCGRVIDTEITLSMLNSLGSPSHQPLPEPSDKPSHAPIPLTRRQRECLVFMAHGKSDWEIGKILNISEQTVHGHIEIIKAKYGCRKRVQAIVKAIFDGELTTRDFL